MVFHQVEHAMEAVDYYHLEDHQSHWSWNQMDQDQDLEEVKEVLEMGF
jgi:hypothetical protein